MDQNICVTHFTTTRGPFFFFQTVFCTGQGKASLFLFIPSLQLEIASIYSRINTLRHSYRFTGKWEERRQAWDNWKGGSLFVWVSFSFTFQQFYLTIHIVYIHTVQFSLSWLTSVHFLYFPPLKHRTLVKKNLAQV